MTTFAYAGYGSNLHPLRLKAANRCPSAKLRGTCVLTGWRLVFRKRSDDGSAKCDAEKTGNSSDELRIAVFDISQSEETALDSAEGLGHGYHKDVLNLTVAGQDVTARIYLADEDAIVTDAPYEWYKQMVLLGAEYHAFPDSYVASILDVDSKTDRKQSRSQQKLDEVERMRAANKAIVDTVRKFGDSPDWETKDMSQGKDRSWTTLWDRQNRRVLLLAGPKVGDHHWGFVKHDPTASVSGVYDIWRADGDIVFVEIHLDDADKPLGFPQDLLSKDLLGSMTIWPMPILDSFIWWHPAK